MFFPLMCFKDEDSTAWQEDENEFCVRHFNKFEEMNDPETSLQSLLVDLCAARGKHLVDLWMTDMINILVQVRSSSNSSAPASSNLRDCQVEVGSPQYHRNSLSVLDAKAAYCTADRTDATAIYRSGSGVSLPFPPLACYWHLHTIFRAHLGQCSTLSGTVVI